MDYEEARETVDKIVEAVKNGDYTVESECPGSFKKCKTPNGKVFYKAYEDDGPRDGDEGYCSVCVGGYSFSCDFISGDCENDLVDELEDEYELDDGSTIDCDSLLEEIYDAFNSRDDIFFYTDRMFDWDDQCEMFCKINGVDSSDIFYSEDPDCPVDVSEITTPDKLGKGSFAFDGKIYYVVDDDWRNKAIVYAVASDAEPTETALYPAVRFIVERSEDGTITAKGIDDDGCCYNAVEEAME